MMQSNREEVAQVPSLTDYVLILVKYKWFIVTCVLISFVGSVVVSMYIPKQYASTTSVISDNPARTLGLLNSRNLQDAIMERAGLKVMSIDGQRRRLNLSLKKVYNNIITITYIDVDPERAAMIANGMVDELNRFNLEQHTSSGMRLRVFAEERLEEVRQALIKADEALLKFEVDNKEITLFNLTNSVAESVKGYLVRKQVEQPSAVVGQEYIETLKEDIVGLSKMLVGLQLGNLMSESDLMASPNYSKLMIEYTRLKRDVKTQQAIYNQLARQYEEAKVQEAHYLPSVQVLDVARVPQVKVKPNRALIVEVSVVGVFLLSLFFSFLLEVMRRARCKPESI